ncbi:hypothetical protein QBC35DRAFT_473624 [Podospora australis]|uniref:Uncharacterized protein n=1 Tax=Podospora australis TaxID=1536484 RepID=A0AAN6WXV0_9PEZI|nr:hypothetical protein QBC35DRAFT_473624 [Podospora australis]
MLDSHSGGNLGSNIRQYPGLLSSDHSLDLNAEARYFGSDELGWWNFAIQGPSGPEAELTMVRCTACKKWQQDYNFCVRLGGHRVALKARYSFLGASFAAIYRAFSHAPYLKDLPPAERQQILDELPLSLDGERYIDNDAGPDDLVRCVFADDWEAGNARQIMLPTARRCVERFQFLLLDPTKIPLPAHVNRYRMFQAEFRFCWEWEQVEYEYNCRNWQLFQFANCEGPHIYNLTKPCGCTPLCVSRVLPDGKTRVHEAMFGTDHGDKPMRLLLDTWVVQLLTSNLKACKLYLSMVDKDLAAMYDASPIIIDWDGVRLYIFN